MSSRSYSAASPLCFVVWTTQLSFISKCHILATHYMRSDSSIKLYATAYNGQCSAAVLIILSRCQHIAKQLSASMLEQMSQHQVYIPADELSDLCQSLTDLVERIDHTMESRGRSITIVNNIRSAYFVLCDRVTTSARTQVGDAERLAQQREEVLRFLAEADQ
ncbi:uncharacterized protein B0H18DRAFT_915081, partial [Fomitopsis serialis]|uniref:uncharacterized protein n=1 Tax=Fomitopsis serialis TaxID=139415 RepID=UPI0020079937